MPLVASAAALLAYRSPESHGHSEIYIGVVLRIESLGTWEIEGCREPSHTAGGSLRRVLQYERTIKAACIQPSLLVYSSTQYV